MLPVAFAGAALKSAPSIRVVRLDASGQVFGNWRSTRVPFGNGPRQ